MEFPGQQPQQPMDMETDFNDSNHHRPAPRLSQTGGNGPMTDDEQRERRASIREIMQDSNLTEIQRRRSIQSLMDGRRRSSGGASSLPGNMSMMAAAAAAAADFYDSSEDDDDDDDSLMDDDDDDDDDDLPRPSVASEPAGINDSNHNRQGPRLSQTGGPMTEDEQRERRASIREIMQDQSLTEVERRRSIQSLMDGRRRSSGGTSSVPGEMSMMAAAAAAAADFYDSSEDDSLMDDDDDSDEDSIGGGARPQHEAVLERRRSIRRGSGTSHASSLSSNGGGAAGVASASSTGGGAQRRASFQRTGRSASLRGFAAGAAAAAAAAAAAFSGRPRGYSQYGKTNGTEPAQVHPLRTQLHHYFTLLWFGLWLPHMPRRMPRPAATHSPQQQTKHATTPTRRQLEQRRPTRHHETQVSAHKLYRRRDTPQHRQVRHCRSHLPEMLHPTKQQNVSFFLCTPVGRARFPWYHKQSSDHFFACG